MGRVKSGILEKIKEGDTVGKEAVDTGTEIKSEGSEIKSLLDSIDTSIDEDDMAAVENANDSYGKDFNEAFDSQAQEKANEAKDIHKETIDTANEEKDKVDEAADTFREMQGVSDIGQGNAGAGADAMKQSAQEYADNISEAEQLMDELDSDIGSLKSDVESIFG